MITPTAGKIFCEILSDITKTDSGLFLARTLKEKPHRAHVLRVGEPIPRTCKNCDIFSCNSNELEKKWKWYKHKDHCSKRGKLMYPCCEVGDIVHFRQGYGEKWRKDEKEYIFLTNQNIICVERG